MSTLIEDKEEVEERLLTSNQSKVSFQSSMILEG